MQTCEVAIIGAGVQGASVAHHLGRAGVRTVVFERETPASGPTGRSSAICRAVYTNQFLASVAHESLGMLAEFADLLGGDSGFIRTGMLYLHPAQDDDRELLDLVGMLQAIGTEVELLGAQQLAAEHPRMITDGTVALWEPGSGHADPAATTRALLDDAIRHGVELRSHTAIQRIVPRAGGGATLHDVGGAVAECERLLIAAGPWTRPLLLDLGVDLPLTVERHFVATFRWDEVSPIRHMIGDISGGYYLKPEGSTQYGVGSLVPEPTVAPNDFQEQVGIEEALALAEPAIRRIPSLGATSFAGGWASLYDVSPDWQPVIGEVAERIYVTAGSSGHGFKLAPALGRQIAGLVSGSGHDLELNQFSPSRFLQGAPLAAGFGDARILG
jgi:sarcosine oxidase subunit beta